MQGLGFAFLFLAQCRCRQICELSVSHQTLKSMVHGPRRFRIDLRRQIEKIGVSKFPHFSHDLGNSHARTLPSAPPWRKPHFHRLKPTPTNLWPTDTIGRVAPAEKPPNPYWLLNLDQIEKDTGYLGPAESVDPSAAASPTYAFTTDHVLYSKLRRLVQLHLW